MRRFVAICGMIVMLLILVLVDMAVRFFLSGRFEPFFNSLAIFTLDFSCILLLIAAFRGIVLRQHVDPPYRVIVAMFLLIGADIVAITVRSALRERTRNHIQELLSERLNDPSRIALLAAVGDELVDVEVFHCQRGTHTGLTSSLLKMTDAVDIMALLNGNEARRQMYANLLGRLNQLKPETSITSSDLMLPVDYVRPWLWIISISALVTVGMYIWLVCELSSPDIRERMLTGAHQGVA